MAIPIHFEPHVLDTVIVFVMLHIGVGICYLALAYNSLQSTARMRSFGRGNIFDLFFAQHSYQRHTGLIHRNYDSFNNIFTSGMSYSSMSV